MDTTESLRAQLELAQKIEWGNGEDGDDEKLARLVLDVRDHGGLARAQRAARRVIEHYQRRRDDG